MTRATVKVVGALAALKQAKTWVGIIAGIVVGIWSIWGVIVSYNAGQQEAGARAERDRAETERLGKWRKGVDENIALIPLIDQKVNLLIQLQRLPTASLRSSASTMPRPSLTLDPRYIDVQMGGPQ